MYWRLLLMDIKVLGPGCANCRKLEKVVDEAVKEIGADSIVEHVSDMGEILSYGVMSLPALVVDGKVKFAGKVLPKDEIVKILRQG
jgi:small redox-active disulfide protein 2